MRWWSIMVVVAIGWLGPLDAAPPESKPGRKPGEDKVTAKRTCPKGHALRQVPLLVGLPSKDMFTHVQRGEALLGGCMGSPDKLEPALVCEKCRQWKTEPMVYWQPLPKEFGTTVKEPRNEHQ